MSGAENLLVTAHSEKKIHIWDLNRIMQNSFEPIHVEDSPLKYETSSLCAFSNGKGFTLGSIEGRCGVVNCNF
jgi:mRNA export factor